MPRPNNCWAVLEPSSCSSRLIDNAGRCTLAQKETNNCIKFCGYDDAQYCIRGKVIKENELDLQGIVLNAESMQRFKILQKEFGMALQNQ